MTVTSLTAGFVSTAVDNAPPCTGAALYNANFSVALMSAAGSPLVPSALLATVVDLALPPRTEPGPAGEGGAARVVAHGPTQCQEMASSCAQSRSHLKSSAATAASCIARVVQCASTISTAWSLSLVARVGRPRK